jgi:hypothetical protein
MVDIHIQVEVYSRVRKGDKLPEQVFKIRICKIRNFKLWELCTMINPIPAHWGLLRKNARKLSV